MKHWLLKTDPATYSIDDLERDKQTIWDGVSNPLAQQHLRSMAHGDPLLLYHTGEQKAILAEGKVAVGPRPDKADKSGKTILVDVAFERRLPKPVPLADIKADSFFADFDLVRISRLSIVPVSSAQWSRLMKMADDAG